MAVRAKQIPAAKTAAVENTKKLFADYNDYIFADFRGMSVEQMTGLRHKLREHDAMLKVVKNNFAAIAFKDMKAEGTSDYLKGPTAIALVKEDPNTVAKTMFDFKKDAPTLVVKGGYVNKEIMDAAAIEAFSKLPGRKQLIAMLMSAINGPARQLAATLQAYVEKKSQEGGVSPAADAPKATASAEKSAEKAEPAKEKAPAAKEAADNGKADAAKTAAKA